MLTQRSTKGTILVDHNNTFTTNFKVKWEQDSNGANEFSLTKDAIDEYKKWRMNIMPDVQNDSQWEFIKPNSTKYSEQFIRDYFKNHPDIISGLNPNQIDQWVQNIINGVIDGDYT